MYNEEKRKAAVVAHLRSIKKYFLKKKAGFEIIVVLDGPKDKTPLIVQALICEIPELRIISRNKNLGKGATVKQGILAAKGKIILFTDSDGSTPIRFFAQAEKELEKGADVVIGSRKLESSVISEKQSFIRRLGGNLGNFLIRAPLGLWGINDTQCGFKAFSNKSAKKIFNRLVLNRFGFDFELLAIAKAQGFEIKEIPVVWKNVGESSVNLKQYFLTLLELVQVFLRRIIGSYR